MKMSDLRALVASIPTSADTFDVMFAAPAIGPGQNLLIANSAEVDAGDVTLAGGNTVVNRPAIVVFRPQ